MLEVQVNYIKKLCCLQSIKYVEYLHDSVIPFDVFLGLFGGKISFQEVVDNAPVDLECRANPDPAAVLVRLCFHANCYLLK